MTPLQAGFLITMNDSGKIGEDLAAAEYQKQGYKIIARNYIPKTGKQAGELDLVCKKEKEIVFVEVKMRNSKQFGGPFESVDEFKQRKLIQMAKYFMLIHKEYDGYEYRIDVAAVAIDNGNGSVTILTNAIEDD